MIENSGNKREALRITQHDLARLAGVSQATVSLALKNNSKIPEETRKRIHELARSRGYVPDPYLSGLSAYRKRHGPVSFKASLAWVSNHPPEKPWRETSSLFRGYYEGAAARAAELGYQIEEMNLREEGMSSNRALQILRAKNITGLLVGPQPAAAGVLDMAMEYFSSVTFGYSLVSPKLHLVTQHHFRSVHHLFQDILKRGYRRPGLVLDVGSDHRSLNLMSSSFWNEQRSLPKADRVALLIDKVLTPKIVCQWLEKHRPDVVIADWPRVCEWIVESGVKVPGEVGFALASVRNPEPCYSGMSENPEVIGACAADLLVDLINRGERGVPKYPISMLIDGDIHEGKTLRGYV